MLASSPAPPAPSANCADAALGTAPLAQSEVFGGLTYQALALLQPCAITVRIAAEPLGPADSAAGGAAGGTPPLQLTAAPEGDAQQQVQQAAYSRFPALTAPVGQPLSVTLSVTNHGCTAAAASSSGGGGRAV